MSTATRLDSEVTSMGGELALNDFPNVTTWRQLASPDFVSPTPVSSSDFLTDRYGNAKAWYLPVKRCLDFIGAVAGIILFSPVLIFAAIAIKWHDGGPIFFRQTRVGLRGKHFTCWKLRSMVINADELKANLAALNTHGEDLRSFKIKDDPRITPIGKFLRQFSLDEVPQFFNVLTGEMSLVGPRPALPEEVELYSVVDRQRLVVKPGLTCFWQVSGRSTLPFSEQIQLDLAYLDQVGLVTDMKLIAKTIPAMLIRDGAH